MTAGFPATACHELVGQQEKAVTVIAVTSGSNIANEVLEESILPCMMIRAAAASTRIFVTHFTPPRRLCRLACQPGAGLVNRTEWLMAHILVADQCDEPPKDTLARRRLQGYTEAQIDDMHKRESSFAKTVSELPTGHRRSTMSRLYGLAAGVWQIVTGGAIHTIRMVRSLHAIRYFLASPAMSRSWATHPMLTHWENGSHPSPISTRSCRSIYLSCLPMVRLSRVFTHG
jgi:hypothetical protein